MLCEKCGKNEATIHYSEIVNGKKTEMALCADCAKEMGISADPFDGFGDIFGTGSLLSNFFGNALSSPTRRSSAAERRCPVCGASMYEIQKLGKVGCAECYTTFRNELLPTIRRIHGDVKFKGASPASPVNDEAAKKARELDSLRDELSAAIKNEDFEHAAQLRDKIRELEK